MRRPCIDAEPRRPRQLTPRSLSCTHTLARSLARYTPGGVSAFNGGFIVVQPDDAVLRDMLSVSVCEPPPRFCDFNGVITK